MHALLALRRDGAEVVAIAGNHDHGPTLDAYRPLMRAAGITLVGSPRTAADGGVVTLTARSTGEAMTVAVLPFLSARWAVRAAELVTSTAAEMGLAYDAHVREIVAALAAGFRDDAVNVVLAHLTVTGGQLGGGERAAQSIFDYHVPATAFPADTHYVALGHLHRRQTLPAACPVVYCGAPLAVDFGEEENTPVVCVVEASPDHPGARPRRADRLGAAAAYRPRDGRRAGRPAPTTSPAPGCACTSASRPGPGCARRSLALLPDALEVRIDPEFAAAAPGGGPAPDRGSRPRPSCSPTTARARGVADDRLGPLFDRLHDRLTGPGG